MSLSLRLWFAIIGLVALVGATLVIIGLEVFAPHGASAASLAVVGVAWALSIPNIGRLRKIVTDQRLGLK